MNGGEERFRCKGAKEGVLAGKSIVTLTPECIELLVHSPANKSGERSGNRVCWRKGPVKNVEKLVATEYTGEKGPVKNVGKLECRSQGEFLPVLWRGHATKEVEVQVKKQE